MHKVKYMYPTFLVSVWTFTVEEAPHQFKLPFEWDSLGGSGGTSGHV